MNWQPIETAPKDGRQILAWDGNEAMCVEFTTWVDGTCFWEFAHGKDGHVYGAGEILTHWMPLPPPPKEST